MTKQKTIKEFKEKVLKKIEDIILESEQELKKNGCSYEDVLNSVDTESYGLESDNNNFSAGRISAMKELKKEILEL